MGVFVMGIGFGSSKSGFWNGSWEVGVGVRVGMEWFGEARQNRASALAGRLPLGFFFFLDLGFQLFKWRFFVMNHECLNGGFSFF